MYETTVPHFSRYLNHAEHGNLDQAQIGAALRGELVKVVPCAVAERVEEAMQDALERKCRRRVHVSTLHRVLVSPRDQGGLGLELNSADRALRWRVPYVRLLDAAGAWG